MQSRDLWTRWMYPDRGLSYPQRSSVQRAMTGEAGGRRPAHLPATVDLIAMLR